MKFLITLLVLTVSGLTFSQNLFESPYVHEGRSFRCDIPDPFEELPSGDAGVSVYSRNVTMLEIGQMTDIVMVGNMINDDQKDLNALMVDAELDILDDVKNPVVDVYFTKSGKEFRTIKGEVGFFGDRPADGYMAITTFEEVIVVLGIFDNEDEDPIDPSMLVAMLESYTEYETDRASAFPPSTESFGFKNSMFDTKLNYDNIGFFPETVGDSEWFWDEDWSEEYFELLVAYGYYNRAENNDSNPRCGIKVFSGGLKDQYKSDLEKLIAVQKVFPNHFIEGITSKGVLTGNDFTFTTYNVTSTGFKYTDHTLYITEVHGEMVFALSYFTSEPTETLKAEMIDVVKTFDYLE